MQLNLVFLTINLHRLFSTVFWLKINIFNFYKFYKNYKIDDDNQTRIKVNAIKLYNKVRIFSNSIR